MYIDRYAVEATVFSKANDIADIMTIAPTQHAPSAEATICSEDYPYIRPHLPEAFDQQVAKVVPDLVVAQMFRGRVVVGSQAADSADIALLGLFGETVELHVFDEFVFDWIGHDLPPWLSE
jgi:hypothetical protein